MAAVARRQQHVAAVVIVVLATVLGSGWRHFMLLKSSHVDVIHLSARPLEGPEELFSLDGLRPLTILSFKPLLFGGSLSKP